MGLECIGEVNEAETAAAVQLALDSLALAADGGAALLVLGHMGFAAGLLRQAGLEEEQKAQAMRCIHDKNAGALAALCGADAAICGMNALCGPWQEVLPKARALAQDEGALQALDELESLCRRLAPKGCGLELDLSLANDSAYYNGLVFRGQISGLARPVLQGGRYDPLASRFSPGARAVGFAIYLNELERLDVHPCGLLSVALPKGRLGDKVFRLLQKAGWSAAQESDSRRLVVEDAAAGVRYFLVKPSDVAIYVEHGAADVGIVGKDVLDEGGADVFELLDTGLGRTYTDEMTVEEIIQRMTLDEARSIMVTFGTCKGWTLGEVMERRASSLRFYLYSSKDAGNVLKAAASLLLDELAMKKAG